MPAHGAHCLDASGFVLRPDLIRRAKVLRGVEAFSRDVDEAGQIVGFKEKCGAASAAKRSLNAF